MKELKVKNKLLTKECPICNSTSQNEMLNLDCGKVDNSPIYQNVIVKQCSECGHIFNELYEEDWNGLLQYYNDEYALTNLSAPDKTGDRPGSESQNSINRFEHLYKLTQKYINADSKVLDIGCAMGGFLNHLKSKGLTLLNGIDFTENFVEHSKNNQNLNIKLGSADNIPFNENEFDILYMDQVLEHLLKPRKAFQEARRVLKKGGYFCIGVPNAMNYSENYIFDFFWFLMKEHIHHFDIKHLELLAQKEGFELVDYNFNNTPMMSSTTYLPNINAVFKLTGEPGVNKKKVNNTFDLSNILKKYIEEDFSKLSIKREIIQKIKFNNDPLYVWGIGREFLYLKQNTELMRCSIKALIDGNSYKREQLSVDGIKIQDPKILSNTTKDSQLIITASSYSNKLKSLSIELGFKGEIIEI